MNLHIKSGLGIKNYVLDPNSEVENENFLTDFRGKFEQKTQKSIFLKNQWKLKNIKKAIVVKNIIAEEMPFTKSNFEQFWRSYCKKNDFRRFPLFEIFAHKGYYKCAFVRWTLPCQNAVICCTIQIISRRTALQQMFFITHFNYRGVTRPEMYEFP